MAAIAALLLAGVVIAGAQALPLQTIGQRRLDLEPQRIPLPVAMPVAIGPSAPSAEAIRMLTAEYRCLAEAMYYEARGEGEAGERAIAEVIFHRLASRAHGRTICAVVYEGADETFCQFSFVCDGSLDRPKSAEAWRATQVLAARLLADELPLGDDTRGATAYHTAMVHPFWPGLKPVTRIGNHIFYRPAAAGTAPAGFRGSLR